MIDALQPFRPFDEREQAQRFHSRERRRSLAGVLDLNRTHRFLGSGVMSVPSIATATVFPTRSRLITFKTAIAITGPSPAGLILELGGAGGLAIWVTNTEISAVAGGDMLASFDNGATLPSGLELDLVVSVRPGQGLVRMWGNGREIARGSGTPGDWADAGDGGFASAPNGAVPALVDAGSQQAPADFQVIEPLSVFQGQVPQHFV